MQLPILSTLTPLFTSITDDFKKLFQGWSLVAGGLFLFLNLLLIYPLTRETSFVRTFESLNTAVQLAIATLALIFFSYLINSLGGSFVALAGGQVFDGTWLGSLLQRRQRGRYKKIKAPLNDQDIYELKDVNRAAYQLAYEFPEEGYIQATRLGNVQAAVADYSQNQYGAHLDTIWPALEASLATNDEKLLEKIRGEQASMTFLCTLTGLLFFTIFVTVPVRQLYLGGSWQAGLAVLLGLFLATYVTYSAAVGRASAWARLVRTALDMHLDEAAIVLGLRPLEGRELIEDNKERWKAVTEWLNYGGLSVKTNHPVDLPKRPAKWYVDESAKPSYTMTCSAPFKADIHVAKQSPNRQPTLADRTLTLPGPSFEYTITITHQAVEGDTAPPTPRSPVNGFVRVTDTAMPSITPPVKGNLRIPIPETPLEREAIHSKAEGKPDALLWPIGPLAYRDSAVLIYRLDSAVKLTLSDNATFVSAGPVRSGRAGLLCLKVNITDNNKVTIYAGPINKERVKGNPAYRRINRKPIKVESLAHEYDPARAQAAWTFSSISQENPFHLMLIPLAEHGLKSLINNELVQPTETIESGNTGNPVLGELPAFNSHDETYWYHRMRTVESANIFPRSGPEASAEWNDTPAAAAALDKYDLMTDEEANMLTTTPTDDGEKLKLARNLNNLACFFVWQSAPNPTKAKALLEEACKQANELSDETAEKKHLTEIIGRNMDALTKAKG